MGKKKKKIATTKTKRSAGCLMLFALPFACVGAFMGYRMASSIVLWQAARGWDETTATLESLELERHSGEDGATYKVVAEYDYEHNGHRYHSDRVGLFGGSDNISNYAHKLHARLDRSFQQKKPVACYVNPSDPSQSLLDRQMRLGMLTFHVPFVLAFGGFGFGAIGYALAGLNKRRGDTDLAKRYPDEPWRWREDWNRGVVRQSTGKETGWVIAAVAWNLVCVPVLLVALATESRDTTIVLVIAGLNLAGLTMLLYAARALWRRARYGVSEFELASTPGVIGGRLAGVVTVPARVPTEDGFTVRLFSQEQRTTHRGGESSTSWFTLWEDERQITRTLDAGRRNKTAVPIVFTIPSDVKQSDTQLDWPVVWKLSVEAATRGPDFSAEFEVPVYLTEDSQDGVVADDAPLSEYEVEPPLEALLARDRIRLERNTPSELVIVARPLRYPALGLGVALFTAVWFAIVAAVCLNVSWIGGGIMGLFGLLGLWMSGETVLNSSRLEVTGDNWQSTAGWWGLRSTTRFHKDEIKRIGTDEVMTSSSSSGESCNWVTLQAHLRDKQKVTLVAYVNNTNAERRLLEELRGRAGLDLKKVADKDKPAEDHRWQDAMDLPAEEP